MLSIFCSIYCRKKAFYNRDHLVLFFLNDTFDGMSCCPPPPNCRNFNAQARIVSALSAEYDSYDGSPTFFDHRARKERNEESYSLLEYESTSEWMR